MTAAPYRRLPGRRRGFFIGASLWMGADHILAVRSQRVREEYKRFHFRDVQAICVARAPRFYFSTADLCVLLLWLAAYLLTVQFRPRETWILWSIAALLVLSWILVSARWSCRCRIYTAVSRDELPSLSRIWTARKFLNQVTPRIVEVQGQTPPDWAELAGEISPAAAAAPVSPFPADAASQARLHTILADLFIATLWANALVNLLALRFTSQAANWSQILFGLVLLGETVGLFVQYSRGLLRRPMQRLAIANLIAIGTMYYLRQMVYSFKAGANQTATDLRIPTFYAGDALTRGIDAGVCAALGLVGLGIIFLGGKPR